MVWNPEANQSYPRDSSVAQREGSGTITAVAQVTAVAWVWSLAQELSHVLGVAKTKPKQINKKHQSYPSLQLWAETRVPEGEDQKNQR